jgi:hypothetical protein
MKQAKAEKTPRSSRGLRLALPLDEALPCFSEEKGAGLCHALRGSAQRYSRHVSDLVIGQVVQFAERYGFTQLQRQAVYELPERRFLARDRCGMAGRLLVVRQWLFGPIIATEQVRRPFLSVTPSRLRSANTSENREELLLGRKSAPRFEKMRRAQKAFFHGVFSIRPVARQEKCECIGVVEVRKRGVPKTPGLLVAAYVSARHGVPHEGCSLESGGQLTVSRTAVMAYRAKRMGWGAMQPFVREPALRGCFGVLSIRATSVIECYFEASMPAGLLRAQN